jgi:hypothetical protein
MCGKLLGVNGIAPKARATFITFKCSLWSSPDSTLGWSSTVGAHHFFTHNASSRPCRLLGLKIVSLQKSVNPASHLNRESQPPAETVQLVEALTISESNPRLVV